MATKIETVRVVVGNRTDLTCLPIHIVDGLLTDIILKGGDCKKGINELRIELNKMIEDSWKK